MVWRQALEELLGVPIELHQRLSDEADNEPLLQMFCCTLSQFLLNPMNNNNSISTRYTNKFITHQLSVMATGMPDEVNLCAKYLQALATSLTRVPLAVITHALVNRMRYMKSKDNSIYETTLELVQYVSVSLESASANHKVFVGDCHSCTLYCEKCNRTFGVRGNIFQVLAKAPHAILYHHGLELTESNSVAVTEDEYRNMEMHKRRFLHSLPMHTHPPFLGSFSLTIIERLENMTTSQRCLFGTGQHVPRNNHDRNIKYLHSLNEAMKIDFYFAGNEDVLRKRNNFTSALLLALFDSAHHHFSEARLLYTY